MHIHKHPIGIFDSGRWWYYTMQAIRTLLPEYDYLFYGDTAHMPYGNKTPEQIRTYTFAGLQWLFDHGCTLVIIACNTAAAYSIRVRQATHPELKTLSVTIPGIEALIASGVRSTLFLSTAATSESGILPDLAYKNNYAGSLEIRPCPWLADLIEEDMKTPLTNNHKKEILWPYVDDMTSESIVLACTHYGVWYDIFRDLLPDTLIIDPSQEAAKMFVDYLSRHPEVEQSLSQWGEMEEYRT